MKKGDIIEVSWCRDRESGHMEIITEPKRNRGFERDCGEEVKGTLFFIAQSKKDKSYHMCEWHEDYPESMARVSEGWSDGGMTGCYVSERKHMKEAGLKLDKDGNLIKK